MMNKKTIKKLITFLKQDDDFKSVYNRYETEYSYKSTIEYFINDIELNGFIPTIDKYQLDTSYIEIDNAIIDLDCLYNEYKNVLDDGGTFNSKRKSIVIKLGAINE